MAYISIIIPVYNASAFIARAVNACLGQSYRDIELVLVNDGSTDGSLPLLNSYAARDSRILVLDKPNEGVVKAREYGVMKSHGEFLLFIDADDQLTEGCLQKMVDAIAGDVDMIIGDIRQIVVNGSSAIIEYGNKSACTGKEHFNWIVTRHIGFLWGKLIRKSLVEQIAVMPYGVKFCEDYLQMLQISYAARKVVHVGDVTYDYIQHDESACNKPLPKDVFAGRFAVLCQNIKKIIDTEAYDDESTVKLKTLFLYYCRLYLWAAGRWQPCKDLKKPYKNYISEAEVYKLMKLDKKNRYYMTCFTEYMYPIFSIGYCYLLRNKYKRIY